jgi:uncharacterized protein
MTRMVAAGRHRDRGSHGRRDPASTLRLVNQRTDAIVARCVEVATTRATRRRGLLGRATFDAPAALILAPCAAVHTMFMRFAIDLVFVDEEGRTLKVVPELKPWRIALEPLAHAAIELPARSIREHGLGVGDRLYLCAADGHRVLLSAGDLRGCVC